METPKVETTLSPLETSLYNRFKTEKAIGLDKMNDKEKGALGKLVSRDLVTKDRVSCGEVGLGGTRMKTVWVLKEEEPISI